MWLQPHIVEHLRSLQARYSTCLDPFAGNGHLLQTAKRMGFNIAGRDVDEAICIANGWGAPNDSILNVPQHDGTFVLTNPPYLAKNSAKRMNAPAAAYFLPGAVISATYKHTNVLDDLFKLAIEQTLAHYEDSIWIVPESVMQDLEHLPHWRACLHSVTVLENNPFTDTEHPVCVLIFSSAQPKGELWKNDIRLGTYDEIWKLHNDILMLPRSLTPMKFNASNGMLGYRAVDGTKEDNSMRIRFCNGDDLGYDRQRIKVSSRHMTYIDVALQQDALEAVIDEANRRIETYRAATHDVFLTAFMGNTKAGVRRRRMDYHLARRLFNAAFLAIYGAS